MEEKKGAVLLFLVLTILLSGVGTVFRKVGVDRMPSASQFQMLAALVYGGIGVWALGHHHVSSNGKHSWDTMGVAMNVLSLLFNAAASITFMKLIGLSNNVGLMSGLTSLNVVITLLLSCVFLHEVVTLRTFAGIALMLLGAFIASKK